MLTKSKTKELSELIAFCTQDLALQQILFFIDLFLSYRTDSHELTDPGPSNVFILLNCWICLHGVLD